MSKVLQEYKFLTETETQRVKELDHAIEALEQEVDIINKFIGNAEKGWVLLEAKLKKERLVALTALTKSKLLLAEMAVYIAENQPNDRCKKSPTIVKPNASEGNPQLTTSLVSSSRNPHRSSSTSCSRHSSVRGILTSLDCRSLSPLKFSNRGSSISKSCSITRSPSQKSRKRCLFRKTDGNLPDRSGRSEITTPYSRNDRKHWSFTQESMDENQQKSPSIKQHKNGKENIGKNETSIPVVPLNNARETSNNIDINKSLTESIIAELDKSSNKENVLPLETSAKKQKINPVSNIDAYKKHFSNNLHVFHTIPGPKIRPLHPGDPRKYPTCDTKEGSISETPLRLPLPQFKVSRLAPAQLKQIEEIREECEHVLSQSEQVQIAPLTVQNINFRHNSSNFIKQNHTENMDTSVYSIPIQTAIVHEHGNTPQREVDNSQTLLSQLSRSPQNIPQQVNSNNPQLAVDKRHICVPVPPMYNYSRNTGRSFGRIKIPEPNHSLTPETNLNLSYKQKYVPMVESSTKTKELRILTGPTRVCFYNSS